MGQHFGQILVSPKKYANSTKSTNSTRQHGGSIGVACTRQTCILEGFQRAFGVAFQPDSSVPKKVRKLYKVYKLDRVAWGQHMRSMHARYTHFKRVSRGCIWGSISLRFWFPQKTMQTLQSLQTRQGAQEQQTGSIGVACTRHTRILEGFQRVYLRQHFGQILVTPKKLCKLYKVCKVYKLDRVAWGQHAPDIHAF